MSGNKNGKKLAIATISTALVIVLTIAGLIWAAATQNYRLDMVVEDVKVVEPRVEQIDDRVIVLEVQQTAIYEGVKRIEEKLDKTQ